MFKGPIWGATQGDPFLRRREGGRSGNPGPGPVKPLLIGRFHIYIYIYTEVEHWIKHAQIDGGKKVSLLLEHPRMRSLHF